MTHHTGVSEQAGTMQSLVKALYIERAMHSAGKPNISQFVSKLVGHLGLHQDCVSIQGQALRHELGLQINRKGADMSKAVPRSAMQGFTNPFQQKAASVLAWPYAVATGKLTCISPSSQSKRYRVLQRGIAVVIL